MKYDSTKATRLAAEGSGIDCAIVVMSTRTPRRRSHATAMRFALDAIGRVQHREEGGGNVCSWRLPSVPGPNRNARFGSTAAVAQSGRQLLPSS